MYIAVDIIAHARQSSTPVAGVVVKVFSEDGRSVYGEQITDTAGVASFLLYGPQRYQIRCFKLNTGIQNPVYIDVPVYASSTASYDIFVTPTSPTTSTDPRFCSCSGYFRTASGTPAANMEMYFEPKFHPMLLEESLVMPEVIRARTNDEGWAQVSLIRFGQYNVVLMGVDEIRRAIDVPDLPSCNLPQLILEMVDSVVVTPAEITMALYDTVEATAVVTTNTGKLLDGVAKEHLCWSVDNPDVASVTVQWDKIIIYGNSQGTTTLRASRSNTATVRIPDPILIGIPIQVT